MARQKGGRFSLAPAHAPPDTLGGMGGVQATVTILDQLPAGVVSLGSLNPGDAFVLLARLASLSPAGATITYFGPDSTPQGSMTIAPDGGFSGGLSRPAGLVPVQRLLSFRVITPGDILQREGGGDTMVARRIRMLADGSFEWSASLKGGMWYPADGWHKIGAVQL